MRVVVCGAGTAGCVAAARLSQDPAREVTLLEVGPHYRPGRWPAALTHSHRIIKETHDWGYLARAGASPRIVHVPRGRVVGGLVGHPNGAIALRGHPEHYDEWGGSRRSTWSTGDRQTPADHYLDPALARPNLILRAGGARQPRASRGGRARRRA